LLAAVGCNQQKARPSEPVAEASRSACSYTAGMNARETVGAIFPTGKDIPIDHVILIMQENRSFDHYYSELPMPGIDAAPETDTNPDSKGNLIQRYHFTDKCMPGGDHSWD